MKIEIRFLFERQNGDVMKWQHMIVLETIVERHAGSSPAIPTKIK